MSIESFKILQGIEVKTRVRIYGPTNSYIPIPSFARYLGFDDKAQVIVIKGGLYSIYEATPRRLSSTRYGITLPRRTIEALNLNNNDEVTVIMLRPTTQEYTIKKGNEN
ncbi:hypothetical protein [Caldivirga sp.]|uniref:hypothetical protein n=1 Tax=Caldivirga sp. TaxID=2080243 RepID=UPI003D0F39C0